MKRSARGAARNAAVGITLALTALLFAGCSLAPSANERSGGEADSGMAAPEPGVQTDEAIGVEREIVSTGTLSLSDPDPIAVADEAVDIVSEAGGHIDSRTDSPESAGDSASASLLARIPADELDTVIEELKELAAVEGSSISQQDVTGEVADLDARVTALETSITRLLSLMEQATTTADLIEIESALSTRQAELDSLTAQRDVLADQVEFATLDVQIWSPGEVAGAAPGDFWGGVVVGFTALGTFFSGLLVVLGVLLPWLIVIAIVTAVVWLIVRRRAGRARTGRGGPGAQTGSLPPRPPLPYRPPVAHREPASAQPDAGRGSQGPQA
ncbi:hypothetical protein GCM10027416_10000 [Okibacterium endophyticum]